MRWMKSAVIAVILALCAVAYCADDDERGGAWTQEQGFVAHEWGVVIQDSRHPYDLAKDLAGTPAEAVGRPKYDGTPAPAKPVLFFYSPRQQTVAVKASMTQGGFAYAYPAAEPVFDKFRGVTALTWAQLTLGAVGEKKLHDFAQVGDGHWWLDCREVASSVAQAEGVAEKFVFYDGMNWAQPALAFERRDAVMAVTNNGEFELPDVFVVHKDKSGGVWGYCERIAPGATVEVAMEGDIDGLAQRFMQAQLAAGLYRDEARAFHAAWRKEFFDNDGDRVFHRLPSAQMDKLLPVDITPKPDKIVRVNWVCIGR